MRATALLLLTPVFFTALVFGCSSSDSPAPATPTPTNDGGGQEAAASGESLTILIVKAIPPPGVTAALPNANVVFDKPGGERVEAQADADGLVTIEGIDWSKGSAALTAFGAGASV